MNNLKNNFIKVLFSIFLITSLSSCDEGGEPDPGMTNVGKYAGDWYITISDSDGLTLAEHVLHSTYNSSANDNSMWIDDHGDGYVIKSKAFVNIATGQFFATDSPNINDGGSNDTTVTITEGQITPYGAVSKGGHPVDRIQFRVHYSYDADGYDIIYDGHRRTGFPEDEY